MKTGIVDLTRLRALVARALDAGSSPAEAQTCAMIACKELRALGIVDESKVVLAVDRASSVASVNVPPYRERQAPPRRPAKTQVRSTQKVVLTPVAGSKKGFRDVE